MNKIVHNLGKPTVNGLIHPLFTQNSQVIHGLIHSSCALAFIQSWWRFGNMHRKEAEYYAKRYNSLAGFSPLGIASIVSLRLGIAGRTWPAALAAMKRACKEPSDLPAPRNKTPHKAS